MEVEYRTDIIKVGKLAEHLNSCSKEGWSLHTILDWGEAHFYVIMEGARAEEPEPEHKPMQMKGYVNT